MSAHAGHMAGHTLWLGDGAANSCTQCHLYAPAYTPGPPQLPQLNAANPSAASAPTMDFVFPGMGCAYATNMSAANRIAIQQYMESLLPAAIDITTPINTNRSVDVSSYIQAGAFKLAFTHVATVSNPVQESTATARGSLSVTAGNRWASGSHSVTYTPPTNWVGYVTFGYRGTYFDGAVTQHNGITRTARIKVGDVPDITSSAGPSGTVGTATTYTFAATNAPTFSVTSGSTPTGMTVGATSISGTPTAAGSFVFNLRATNNLGIDNQSTTYTIGRGTPTVATFPVQAAQVYSPSGTFAISPAATLSPALAESQIDATYTSQTPSVCTTPGTTSTTVTIVSAGTCTIRASTVLSTNWFASSNSIDRNITINQAPKSINWVATQSPASQNWSSGGTFPINPLATTTPAAQAITYGSSTPTVCSVAGTTVTSNRAGLCTLTANSAADTNYTAAVQQTSNVTINAIAPAAPTIGIATAGDTQASIAFTPLNTTNDGGAAILQYTATCNPGAITGINATSPIVVSGLINEQLYSCSVTATQVAPHSLTGAASGTVGVTPQPTPVPPNITSANSTTFTVATPGTFDITATGVPAPTISVTGTLPAGIAFNGPGTSPRTLSGTPASGTFGTYPLTIAADGTDPDATQNFTLTIAKRSQAINFADPPDSAFGSGNVALTSNPTSGLAVTYTSLTPAFCGISGSNATLLDVGNCTIQATQGGNIDWSAAAPEQQTFAIGKGAQVITFNAQAVTSRPVAPGGTFQVDPPGASASSGLAVSYSTTDASVCTASGTTITMHNAGTCGIVASQAGDARWFAAPDVTRNVTLTVASQAINFPPQPAQPYLLGGTFAIVEAVASSGLTVTYSTDTTSVCTVAGTTVSIVAVGTCTLKADQAGNANFTAAPTVTQDVTIQAVVPKAPTISLQDAGNQFARITFIAPADDGGSTITGYVATCNPGPVAGNGTTSPLTVTGLTNGTAYVCSVAAVNAVGTGASSNTVNPTPSMMGAALWATHCQSCHAGDPSGARFNYSGSSLSTQVLDYIIPANPEMNTAPLNALNSLERLDLKAYISSFLPAISETTAPNLAKTISVGSHLAINTVFQNGNPGSFSHVVIDTPPANGTLSAFNGLEVVYTPNPGYTGPDSFAYHGQRTSPTVVTGDSHTVSITVTAAAPVLTVSRIGTGTGHVFSDAASGIDCGIDCSEAYNPGTLVILYALPDPGTTFIGWGGACTGTDVSCVVTMDAAKSVTTTFDLTPFDLSVSLAGAGSGSVSSMPTGVMCGATCTVGFPPGTLVTLTPVAAMGSAFTGWGGACTGTGACVVTMDAARSVTASFEPTFALAVAPSGAGAGSVASSPAGIDCGATCGAQFVTGTVVTLTATPAAGSAFTGWGGECTGTGACSVTMTAARSVTADFTPLRTLTVGKLGSGTGTVSSLPAGIACGATCSADFLDGVLVELSAAVGPDSEFLGWGGACTGTGACIVTMDAAKGVTANFKSSFQLSITRTGSGSGIVTSAPAGVGAGCGTSCSVGFDPGTVVTLGQSPSAGSVFGGWSGACTGTGACVLTMSQSHSVTATFVAAAGPRADLSIASHGSNPAAAASVGQDVAFVLAVANNGPDAATGVVLTDTLPAGATFVSASPGCAHVAGVVTCAIGSLASGAMQTFEVVTRFAATGGATNYASVVANEVDPFGFNNASALAISITAANQVRLGNISTRGRVLAGNDVLIGGFVIGGAGNKTVVVRARGPSLIPFGITNALANPQLQLVRSSDQVTIATNDDWQTASNAGDVTASGFAPSNDLEAAILVSLPPGAYTAIVSGAGGTTGVGIFEVFEVTGPDTPLANISTRGQVLTGNDAMIGGFVVQGSGPQTVVVRARGPSLVPFGITNALANPTLTLVRSSDQAVIATNDDWQAAANAAAITASGFAPSNALEAAILITLQPGAYTAIVTGAGGVTGVAIVEVFAN